VEAVMAERKEYIERMARFESAEGIDDKLSAPLNDQNFQSYRGI
jgi:hypothetical protein